MIHLAINIATKSTHPKRLGAVITRGHRVLASAYNQLAYCKLHPLFTNSTHAEMAAIQKVLNQPNGLQKLQGATIFVARITQKGHTALAKPCQICSDLIRQVGIKKVVYTTDSNLVRMKIK